MLRWSPQVTLAEGLARTARWIEREPIATSPSRVAPEAQPEGHPGRRGSPTGTAGRGDTGGPDCRDGSDRGCPHRAIRQRARDHRRGLALVPRRHRATRDRTTPLPTGLAHQPLNYTAPSNFFGFNQAPWLLPITAPFAMLPRTGCAHGMAGGDGHRSRDGPLPFLPRRPWVVLLFMSAPVWMSLVWGNVEALVALGLAAWLVGRQRASGTLMTVGILLTSLKVAPAIPLVILTARSGRWRPIVAAIGLLAAWTFTLTVVSGTNVMADFVQVTANIEPVTSRLDLATAIYLGATPAAYLAVRIGALAACLLMAGMVTSDLAALVGMQTVCCLLATNVYADWLLIPLLAGLAWLAEREGIGLYWPRWVRVS